MLSLRHNNEKVTQYYIKIIKKSEDNKMFLVYIKLLKEFESLIILNEYTKLNNIIKVNIA